MSSEKFNQEKIIQYWLEGSEEDFETMIAMYNSKRYSWALFIGHLIIEKLLKAYYIKKKLDYPPYIHNLLRLAELSGINLTEERKVSLLTITAFNINARYDDYKNSFNKKCTVEYTSKWIEEIKELRLWIKELVSK